jgi:hypothetical protein
MGTMKVYKNQKRGSYDVLTSNALLFHVEKWGARFVGVVNSAWQPNGKLLKKIPSKISTSVVNEMAKNGRKYEFLLKYYENLNKRN